MAVLTTKRRKQLAAKVFGLPGSRRFPMPNKSHARAALSGASRALHAGTINSAEKVTVDAKAHRVLGR